jgi:hypothetical protein
LNQILKCQTSHFHYGSKVPAVTITVFITKWYVWPQAVSECFGALKWVILLLPLLTAQGRPLVFKTERSKIYNFEPLNNDKILNIFTVLQSWKIKHVNETVGESIKQVDHEKSTIPFTGNYNEKTEKYSDRKNNSQANNSESLSNELPIDQTMPKKDNLVTIVRECTPSEKQIKHVCVRHLKNIVIQ